jgi:hypothetical protein
MYFCVYVFSIAALCRGGVENRVFALELVCGPDFWCIRHCKTSQVFWGQAWQKIGRKSIRKLRVENQQSALTLKYVGSSILQPSRCSRAGVRSSTSAAAPSRLGLRRTVWCDSGRCEACQLGIISCYWPQPGWKSSVFELWAAPAAPEPI